MGDANKTMGREFAVVVELQYPRHWKVDVWGVPGLGLDFYDKAIADGIAERFNESLTQALESAVKELKAERDGLAKALMGVKTKGRHWCLNAPGEKEVKDCPECDIERILALIGKEGAE